jgi:hypothetical protein
LSCRTSTERCRFRAAAHVALAGENGTIQPGSDHAVTFDGQSDVVIPPGAEWISDPIAFQVDPLSKLAVSLYFQGVTPVTTTHWEGRDTAYITEGNTGATRRSSRRAP